MSPRKKSPPPKLSRWRISRLKATPAVELGYLEAPDAEQAIKVAIERYGITNPMHQQKLVAQLVK
jgi:hypothetical protein